MTGTTNFHIHMILSTLSLSARDFTFSFSKKPRTTDDNVSYLYIPDLLLN